MNQAKMKTTSVKNQLVHIRPTSSLALAVLLTPALVFAQAVPDAGRILEQAKPPVLQRPPAATGKVLPDVAPPAGTAPQGRQKVMVQRFVLKGVSAMPEADVQAVLKPYTGRELTFAELNQATAAITAFYRARGYFVASAALPSQEVGRGEVTIQVLEGRLSQVMLAPDASVRLKPAFARRYFDALLPAGQPVREDALERALLLTQDHPGVNARAELSQGAKLGESALAVQLSEGSLVSGSVSVDNGSNRYTGRVRASGGLNLNDVDGRGGQVSLMASTTGSDFQYGRAAYLMPVGDTGTRAGLAYSHLRYALGAEFESLNASGTAAVFQVLASHPLIRSRYANLQLRAGFDDKRFENRANGAATSDKHVKVVPVSLNYGRQGEKSFTTASLEINPGRVDLSGNAGSAAADASGAKTAGHFVHANYQLGRYQRLQGPVSLLFNLNGQLASKNLESGEKMSLGGPGRVRAYPSGEASGDAGYVMTAEAHYDLSAIRTDLSAFFDYGHITLNHGVYTGALAVGGSGNSYSLKGVGVGATWRTQGGSSLQLQVARKLGHNPGRNVKGLDSDGTDAAWRAWFVATAVF